LSVPWVNSRKDLYLRLIANSLRVLNLRLKLIKTHSNVR
jgi:hypothetical protein